MVEKLVLELERKGIRVRLEGEKVKLRPPVGQGIPAEVVAELREHKPEVIAYLKDRGPKQTWPEACFASAWRFGQTHAILFPLIGHRVMTPRGPGRLDQVFTDRVTVILESDRERLSFFLVDEIGLET